MNTQRLITSLCCLLITVVSSIAQNNEDTVLHKQGRSLNSGGETRLLHHLLKMDDTALQDLGQTVERIQKMSPQEKQQLRERIGKISPEKVDAMRKNYQSIPKEKRDAMHSRWKAMSPEERTQWREQIKTLTPADRRALFEAQGFMIPHLKHGKKDAREKRPEGKGKHPPSGTELAVPSRNTEN